MSVMEASRRDLTNLAIERQAVPKRSSLVTMALVWGPATASTRSRLSFLLTSSASIGERFYEAPVASGVSRQLVASWALR